MIRSLAGKAVAVTAADAVRFEGTFLAGLSDTVRLQSMSADTIVCLPLSRIVMIEVAGNAWGPLVGLIGGGIAGGLVGGAIGSGGSGPDSFGSVDENMGALIGGVAGAAVGTAIGANVTATDRYTLPDGGMRIRRPVDTITVQVDRILRETELSVTIPWYDGTTTLPKARISVERKRGGIYIRVPRSLLYEDGRPRYIDDHR